MITLRERMADNERAEISLREWMMRVENNPIAATSWWSSDRYRRVIDHLDVVGWPDKPKTCETCAHREYWEHQDVCGRCHEYCDNHNHGCRAWKAKEKP